MSLPFTPHREVGGTRTLGVGTRYLLSRFDLWCMRLAMTVAAKISGFLRQGLKPLALLVCLAGLLTAQLALAADQVEDLSAIGTVSSESDGCAPNVLTNVDDESHEPGTPTTHCQSCCFHHNGQTGATAHNVGHPSQHASTPVIGWQADRLTSASLSAERDPPRS